MKAAPSREAPAISGLKFLDWLGSGGFADVFLYEQLTPRRKVAVKVLRDPDLDDTLRRQFLAEADAMAELADYHPNIVPVFSAAETDDGRPYLLMRYYPNPHLGVRAAQSPLPIAEVIRTGIQVSGAVETAHRAGLLHRDIKPANILTDRHGSPGLTDFGISARLAAAEDPDEDVGVSVPWAPPEVLFATAPASVRSDVYALGATLWHLLVGRSPYEISGGDNRSHSLMHRIRNTPPPSTGRGDVPTSLDRLLQQTMAKDPATRPASALALARSLQSIEQELRLSRTEIIVATDDADDVPRSDSGIQVREMTRTISRTPQKIEPQSAGFIDRIPAQGTPAAISRPRPAPKSSPRPQRELAATIHRPAAEPGAEPVESTPQPRRGTRRSLVLAGVGLLAIVSIVVGVLLSGSSGNQKSPSATGSAGTADAQDPGSAGDDLPPGPVTVTAQWTDNNVASFSLSYTNAAPSDTFKWRTPNSSRTGTSATNPLEIAGLPAGSCIEVQVVRQSGSNGSAGWSSPGCLP